MGTGKTSTVNVCSSSSVPQSQPSPTSSQPPAKEGNPSPTSLSTPPSQQQTPQAQNTNTVFVCPEGSQQKAGVCDYIGPKGIQEAINAAPLANTLSDSDIDPQTLQPKPLNALPPPSYTILIQPGTYTFDALKPQKQQITDPADKDTWENTFSLGILKKQNILIKAAKPNSVVITQIGAQEHIAKLKTQLPRIQNPNLNGDDKPAVVTNAMETLKKKWSNSRDLGPSCLLYYQSRNITLEGITLQKCEYTGVNIISSTQNTLMKNTTNNNSIGISLYMSTQNTVSGNTINDNAMNGIELISSSQNTVSGNTINNTTQIGIDIDYSTQNTLLENTVNNSRIGVFLHFTSQTTLSDNTVSNSIDSGINLETNSSQNTFSKNILKDNKNGIEIATTFTNNNINNNVIIGWKDNVNRAGIVFMNFTHDDFTKFKGLITNNTFQCFSDNKPFAFYYFITGYYHYYDVPEIEYIFFSIIKGNKVKTCN